MPAASEIICGKRPLSTLAKPASSLLQNCLKKQWKRKSTGVADAAGAGGLENSFAKKARKFAPIVPRKSALTAKIDAVLKEFGGEDVAKLKARLETLEA